MSFSLILMRRDSLQSVLRPPLGVVLLLIGDVLEHPAQIVLPKAHHPVPSLPVQLLSSELGIQIMGAGPLELLDQLADGHTRLNVTAR
jgi:hypothetical protein